MDGTFLDRVNGWLKKPYSSDMDIVGWLAFFALSVIATYFWTRVLRVIVLSTK